MNMGTARALVRTFYPPTTLRARILPVQIDRVRYVGCRKTFATSTSIMAPQITDKKASDLLELIDNRRTYYALKSSSTISDSKIQEILEKILLTVPSAFNNQTTRAVLLLHDNHKKLWDITGSLLKARIGEERYNSGTKGRMEGFRNAYGSILWYTDTENVKASEAQFASYKEHFGAWAEQTQGMHQLAAWVALEAEGLGGNLQHYNPLIDEEVGKAFNIPEHWQLRAQLVFGAIEGDRPAPKDKKPVSELVKVFGQ